MKKSIKRHWHSLAVTAGRDSRRYNGLVNPPIYHGSTVLFPTLAELNEARSNPFGRTFYGRMGTPTIFALEEGVALLYGGDGRRAVATCSGLAAIVCLFHAHLRSGDTLLVADNVYEPTRRYCVNYLRRLGINVVFYPPMIAAAIEEYIDPSVKMIFMESPGSLTFEVEDIPAVTAVARKKAVMTVIDNTWATALYYNPFDDGVDIVIEAATKYITGHADAMLGVIVCGEAFYQGIKSAVVAFGNAPGPDACYFGQRGLRTLPLRLPRHQENGLALADFLSGHKDVLCVLHPSLPSCPGHESWRRLFSGASGLFSFILPKRSERYLAACVDTLTFFGLGYSWGGYESLILPVTLHKESLPIRYQRIPSLRDGVLLRLHAGLEDSDDLCDDLAKGLERYFA